MCSQSHHEEHFLVYTIATNARAGAGGRVQLTIISSKDLDQPVKYC